MKVKVRKKFIFKNKKDKLFYDKFKEKYCTYCGTQSCLARPQDLSHCSSYNGEIDGIPKIKSFWEEFKETADWDAIREVWTKKNET